MLFRSHPRPHIVHEQTGGVGKCLLVLDTDADGTVEMQGRMADLDGRWAVPHHQLRQQADALKSKLRAGGFPAFVQQANVGGSVWYRVKLGPYRSAATASKSSSAVVSSGIAGACAISR